MPKRKNITGSKLDHKWYCIADTKIHSGLTHLTTSSSSSYTSKILLKINI